MSGMYYDKAGQPISREEWAALRFDPDGKVSAYARIGFNTIGDVEVSTVWLGLNHEFTVGAPPVIYETMVFGGEHDQDLMRYRTEREAIDGHARAVDNIRRGRALW
jgi:hypothetical protein